jgi:hypothetical protein
LERGANGHHVGFARSPSRVAREIGFTAAEHGATLLRRNDRLGMRLFEQLDREPVLQDLTERLLDMSGRLTVACLATVDEATSTGARVRSSSVRNPARSVHNCSPVSPRTTKIAPSKAR